MSKQCWIKRDDNKRKRTEAEARQAVYDKLSLQEKLLRNSTKVQAKLAKLV